MKTLRAQSGFSAVEALLVIVVLGILGFTGWFVYHAQKSADTALSASNKAARSSATKVAAVTNFAECQKATGSVTQQSYPETCVTKAGKSFTDTPASDQKYLTITEWGVKFALPTGVADASYNIRTGQDGSIAMVLSSKEISNPDCQTDLGHVTRFTADTPDGLGDDDAKLTSRYPNAGHVQDYYYGYTPPQSYCSDDKSDATQEAAIWKLFEAAVQSAQKQ